MDHILVLMVEVFAPFGKAHGGKAFAIEGAMVAATQITVGSGDEKGLECGSSARREVRLGHAIDGARKLAGRRVVFKAERADAAFFLRCRGAGYALGEDADAVLGLERVSGRGVAAHNVVVENSFEIPPLVFGKLGKMRGTDQALLLPGHGDEHQRGGQAELAEGAGRLERNGDARRIVVCSRSDAARVHDVGIARVIMARNKIHGVGLRGIVAAQDGVDIGDARRLRNAIRPGAAGRRGRVGRECVAAHIEAAAAFGRNLLELFEYPIRRGLNTGPGGQVGFHAGKRVASLEADELGDDLVNALAIDGSNGASDGRIGPGGSKSRGVQFEIGLWVYRRRCLRLDGWRDDGKPAQQEHGSDAHQRFSTEKAGSSAAPDSLSTWAHLTSEREPSKTSGVELQITQSYSTTRELHREREEAADADLP